MGLYIPASTLRGTQTKWVGTLTKSNEKGKTVKDGEYITLKKGDKTPIELNDEQAAALKGLVVPYRARVPKLVAAEEDADSNVNPLDGNVKQVVAYVKTIDDTDALLELATAEEKGQNRKGVLDAIDARMDEIEQAGAEE